jgi:hypothetical protein
MIQAELRSIFSPDAPDLPNYAPPDPECFAILVQAEIGAVGEEGADTFDFLVRAPLWPATEDLNEDYKDSEYLFARHYLIVLRYSYEVLYRALKELCDETSGPDWRSVAEQLARYTGVGSSRTTGHFKGKSRSNRSAAT